MNFNTAMVTILEWIFTVFIPSILIVGLFDYFAKATNKIQFKIVHIILNGMFALLISNKFWYVVGLLGRPEEQVSAYAGIVALIAGAAVAVVAIKLASYLSNLVSETYGPK